MTARAVAVAFLVLATLAVGGAVALGAEPSAGPGATLTGGDLRSEGTGPGLVGNPLLILGAVVLLGAGTVLVTLVLLRLTQRD